MRRRTTENTHRHDHPRGQQGVLAPMRLTMAGAQNMISALSNSPPVVTKPNTSVPRCGLAKKLLKSWRTAGQTRRRRWRHHHIDDKAPEARHTQQLCRRTQRKAAIGAQRLDNWALLLLSGRDSQSSRPSTSAKPEAIQKVILGSMPNSTLVIEAHSAQPTQPATRTLPYSKRLARLTRSI